MRERGLVEIHEGDRQVLNAGLLCAKQECFDANEPFSCKPWAEKRTVHAAAQSVQHSSNMVGQRVVADFSDIPQSGQYSGRDGHVSRAEAEVFASEAVVNPAVDSGRHDGGLRADLGKEQMVVTGGWRQE